MLPLHGIIFEEMADPPQVHLWFYVKGEVLAICTFIARSKRDKFIEELGGFIAVLGWLVEEDPQSAVA